MEKQTAIEEAINWAIQENLLDGLFKTQKAEVIGMSLTEFDEEEFKQICRDDKAIETALNLIKMNILTPEQIAQATTLPLTEVLEQQKQIKVMA